MKSTSVIHIQSLLEKYRAVSNANVIHTGISKFTSIKNLLDSYKPFAEILKEEHRISTPHFNVFNIFDYDYNEVKIHTPLLYNFLRIDGSHAQGKLFFDAFLKEVLKQNDNVFTNYSNKYLQIRREYSIPGGRIDIFILHSSPIHDEKFAIIFENKLNAGDGVAQLDKYYKYAKESLRLSDAQILLVYLKPNMSDPSDQSISKELLQHLVKQNALKTIGYSPHIKQWLSICNESIQSEKLKQTILQYIELINQISYEEDQY